MTAEQIGFEMIVKQEGIGNWNKKTEGMDVMGCTSVVLQFPLYFAWANEKILDSTGLSDGPTVLGYRS